MYCWIRIHQRCTVQTLVNNVTDLEAYWISYVKVWAYSRLISLFPCKLVCPLSQARFSKTPEATPEKHDLSWETWHMEFFSIDCLIHIVKFDIHIIYICVYAMIICCLKGWQHETQYAFNIQLKDGHNLSKPLPKSFRKVRRSELTPMISWSLAMNCDMEPSSSIYEYHACLLHNLLHVFVVISFWFAKVSCQSLKKTSSSSSGGRLPGRLRFVTFQAKGSEAKAKHLWERWLKMRQESNVIF